MTKVKAKKKKRDRSGGNILSVTIERRQINLLVTRKQQKFQTTINTE